MNETFYKTTISIGTTKPASKITIQKRTEFDKWGRPHVVENVRGIRI